MHTKAQAHPQLVDRLAPWRPSLLRPILARASLACILLLPSVSHGGFVEDITALYESGNPLAAYEKARQHLIEGEGDLDFDTAYGLAAIDAGFTSQGVFALERVLLLEPANHRIRLEVARGYYILEQYDRARREFETVLESNPPESVQANIRRFINNIRIREGRYRTTATFYTDLERGWDSNINSAPGSPDFVSPVLGVGVLNESSTGSSSWFTQLDTGVGMTYPVSPGRYVLAKADLNRRHNDRGSDFDTGAETLTLGLTQNIERTQFSIKLKAQDYHLNYSRYRSLTGLVMDFRENKTDQLQLTGSVSLFKQTYPGLENRNADLFNASAGFIKAISAPYRPVVFLTGFLGSESPNNEESDADAVANRSIVGAGGGFQLSLNADTSLTGVLSWQQSRYAGENAVFQVRREDDTFSGSLSLKRLLDEHWSVTARAAYTKNDSNITINRYDREELSLNLRYEY